MTSIENWFNMQGLALNCFCQDNYRPGFWGNTEKKLRHIAVTTSDPEVLRFGLALWFGLYGKIGNDLALLFFKYPTIFNLDSERSAEQHWIRLAMAVLRLRRGHIPGSRVCGRRGDSRCSSRTHERPRVPQIGM
jgi:hypothetical protein